MGTMRWQIVPNRELRSRLKRCIMTPFSNIKWAGEINLRAFTINKKESFLRVRLFGSNDMHRSKKFYLNNYQFLVVNLKLTFSISGLWHLVFIFIYVCCHYLSMCIIAH